MSEHGTGISKFQFFFSGLETVISTLTALALISVVLLTLSPSLLAQTDEAHPVARVSVATGALGRDIPRDFIGFSLEVSTGGQGLSAFHGANGAANTSEQAVYALGNPGAPNAGFFQFMRNFGPGILRLGGNSQDNSCWDRAQAPHPDGCQAELTPGDLKLFSDAAQASGWHLIVGINLKQNSPSWALREVTQGIAREINPHDVLALEIGNEPDLFSRTSYRPESYSPKDQVKEFLAYLHAFRSNPAAKQYAVVGPATCCAWRNARDLSIFAGKVGPSSLKWLTVHNYSATTCNGQTVSIERLLSRELMDQFNHEARPLVAVARGYELPIAMAETNSASCGGMPGVSNSFAAALWGLDYAFSMAQDGFVNADFHSSYRPGGSSYNPVDTYGTQSASGEWHYRNVAEPLYYGLYLFSKNASGKHLLPASIEGRANIRAYALSTCSRCDVKIVILNKDTAAAGSVQVRLDHKMGPASLLLLSAPHLDSRAEDVRYGGQQFDSDGKIAAPETTAVTPDSKGTYTFTLPNSAAAVLTITPAKKIMVFNTQPDR